MQDDLLPNQERPKSNSVSFSTFQCEDLLEKLKMLNFEKALLREVRMKPFGRFFFVKPVNPGEQFYTFSLLAWWLCGKVGKEMQRPQESDDPNVFISKVMQILESTDFPVDFQPSKLISGAGPACLFVLNCLATQALKIAEINCQKPFIAEEDEEKVECLDENAEIILEKLADDQNTEQSDESDLDLEGGMQLRTLNWLSRKSVGDRQVGKYGANDGRAIDNLSEQQEWRLELERVVPKLVVLVKADTRDWRSHVQQMGALKRNMDAIFDDTQLKLKKLHSELTYSLDKVESREKHLNNELQGLVRQFKEATIELSSLKNAQQQIQKDAENAAAELSRVVVENDVKRAEMEKRGHAMADGSSVLQIRKAMARLKDDVSRLNVEVAILAHSIDQEVTRSCGAL